MSTPPPGSINVLSCRRDGRRVPCRLRAVVRVDGREFACTVEDISPRGARISLRTRIGSISGPVCLEIPRLGAVFVGEVAWMRDGEAGLKLSIESMGGRELRGSSQAGPPVIVRPRRAFARGSDGA